MANTECGAKLQHNTTIIYNIKKKKNKNKWPFPTVCIDVYDDDDDDETEEFDNSVVVRQKFMLFAQ